MYVTGLETIACLGAEGKSVSLVVGIVVVSDAEGWAEVMEICKYGCHSLVIASLLFSANRTTGDCQRTFDLRTAKE